MTQPAAEVLDITLEFLVSFDVCQVRYVGATLCSLLEKVGAGTVFPVCTWPSPPPYLSCPLKSDAQAKVAVELLVTAILHLDPSGSIFTSTHLVLARLAYASNIVEPALLVLDADILFYPCISSSKETRHLLCDPDLPPSAFLTPVSGLTKPLKSVTVLEYNFLRGMLYISRKNWPKALAALEQVVSHPSRNKGVSKIMTEAHKKWLLVGLLNQGTAPRLPSYTSPTAQSSYQAMNEAYSAFASLFHTDQVDRLRASFDTNSQTWEADGNASLVAEAMSAYQKWQIINLRQVFMRVSISEVRRTTRSAETGEPLVDDETTLALVRDMIGSGLLVGEVETGQDDEECYLAFGDAHSVMSEAEFAKEVVCSQQSIEALSSQYRLTNERLTANKDYVWHLIREQRRLETDKDADTAVGFDTQIEDEDLMTGVLAHV